MKWRALIVLISVGVLLGVAKGDDDWALRVEDILSEDLVLTYPEGVILEGDVTRQDDADFQELPIGMTYCAKTPPREDGEDERGPRYCESGFSNVTNGIAVYDVLQDTDMSIVETFVIFVRLPEGVDKSLYGEPVIAINNTQLVDPSEVVIDEVNTLDGVPNSFNYTLTIPVKNNSVGIVEIDASLRNRETEAIDYNTVFRVHVLGIVLTEKIEGPGQLFGQTLVVEKFSDLIVNEADNLGAVVGYDVQYFSESATSTTDPSLEDIKLSFADYTDWNQVTFLENCSSTTAVLLESGILDLPDPNCGMGLTPDGKHFAMRFNPNRVGDRGLLDVEFLVDGLTANYEPDQEATFHSITTITDWELAPVSLSATEYSAPLNFYGGSLVVVRGYNLPTYPMFTYSLNLVDVDTGDKIEAYELVNRRTLVKDVYQQEITYATAMGQGEDLLLQFEKTIPDGTATPFNSPEGDVFVSYGPKVPPPEGTVRVKALFFIREMTAATYYSDPLKYIDAFASLGEKTGNVDAFTEAIAEGTTTIASSRMVNSMSTTSRQEVNGLAVDFDYWVPSGGEEELRRNVQLNSERGAFEDETGYGLVVQNIEYEQTSIGEETPRVVDGVILTTVAVALLFSISGQTATVIVAAEVVATSSSQIIPSALNVASTSSVNTVSKVLIPIQLLSARGLVNVGTTDPYINVAASSTGYMLRYPLPWHDNLPSAPVTREAGRKLLNVGAFYDALGNTNFTDLFTGQLFYIALSIIIAVTLHTTLHLTLRHRKRAHRICMRLLTKIEVMFLNVLHLGIFISVAEILQNRSEVDTYLVLAAILVLFLFGLGYPTLVLYIVFKHVRPRLNAEWLKNYVKRFLLYPSWPCFENMKSRTELESMELAWQQENVEQRKFAYVVHKHSRWSGRWQSEGPKDDTTAMFGTFFMMYKGQFYAYFLVELFLLALEGIFVGALSGNGKVQAILILVIEAFSLTMITWLLPFNDWFENLVNFLVAALQVSIAAIQVHLADPSLDFERRQYLSFVMLIINLVVIGISVFFVLFSVFEALWVARRSIKKCCGDLLACRGSEDKDKDSESVDSYQYTGDDHRKKPEYALYYMEYDRTDFDDLVCHSPKVTLSRINNLGSSSSHTIEDGLHHAEHDLINGREQRR